MKTNRTLHLTITVALLLLLGGCASGTLLSSRSLAGLETSPGAYNLILYGGQNARDFRSIVILDRVGDPYTILPFGAAFNYRIIDNLTAAEAMARGERFINDLAEYRTMERREIYAPDKTVIGYELRPLYMPLSTGLLGDLLDTSYLLQAENRVLVYVNFKKSYHDPLTSPANDSSWGR